MSANEKDLDDGLRFAHVMGMQTKLDVQEAAATAYALAEELIARGLIDLRGLEARRTRIKEQENERSQGKAFVQVAPAADKYQLTDLPQIDCEARLPLCKGRCCKLTFPLSFQDLDEGVVKWDYSRPYQIRKRADLYCVHNDEQTLGCRVYENRPAICRQYDCRNDKRVWIDFEKRIPAPDDAIPGGPAR
jgi:Putative zinc- or iron-chelating domain